MQDLTLATAREQMAALNSRSITAVALLEQHVSRHQALHGKLNAVIATDLPRARRDAAAIDAARAEAKPAGPLAGLPMTIKDCFDVEGMPAVAGSPALKGRSSACRDAVVVARARAAGAVIWGKTNVPYLLSDYQTFNDVYGTTNNPYDLARTTAGSSGGAAAALACGITPLEIGSDLGGSLRNPANFCGVVSVKPTHGSLPCAGHIPPMPGENQEVDLNVVGPMARNAGDLRLLLEVLSGEKAPAPFAGAPRISVWTDEPGFPLAGDVRQGVGRAVAALGQVGEKPVPSRLPFSGSELMHVYFRLLMDVIGKYDDTAIRQARPLRPLAKVLGLIDRRVWSPWNVVKALTAPPAEIARARRLRDELKEKIAAHFTRYDAILAPVTPVTPFKHDHRPILRRSLKVDGKTWLYTACLSWVALANALHLPSVTIQAGQTSTGLPVGAQLIGPWGSEWKLLDIAERMEPHLGGFRRPPIGV